MIKKTALALVTVAALTLLTGCGAGAVTQSDVEDKIASQLTEQVGQAPDSVVCPGDLAAEVGKTMECTMTVGADELPVTVNVTKVDGSDVNFDISVGDIK
jgi:hypothetical protein